jgi:hypothetical protein
MIKNKIKNKTNIVYIASPYSHSDAAVREKNYQLVSKYTAELIAGGQTAISPIAYGHPLLSFTDMPSDWEFWQSFCLDFLRVCSSIHVLRIPGWDQSRGVAEEIAFAQKLGIPVYHINPDDLGGL